MQKQIQQDPKRTAQKFTKTELQISRKRIRSERRRKNKNRERLPKRNYLTNAEIVGRAIDLLGSVLSCELGSFTMPGRGRYYGDRFNPVRSSMNLDVANYLLVGFRRGGDNMQQ
ncbi:hypothetical protein AAC387_Pa11g0770 [Persea americana]